MHQIQNEILGALLFKNRARFTELNAKNVPNDHFTFHLKRLAEQELVEKDDQGFYMLTRIGKEYANRLDVDSEKIGMERQAKTAVLVIAIDDSGKERKYLVQQRLKHPYYGFYGFISGKIKWGESVYEAAARELKEEANLEANVNLAGIWHKTDYSQKNELLEDKYFYLIAAGKPAGELFELFKGGKNIWLTKKEIKKLPDLFDDIFKVIEIIDKDKFTFFEDKYKVARY